MKINKLMVLLVFGLLFTYGYSTTNEVNIKNSKQETTLNNKINTENLSGINLWVAKLYNNDRILYAIIVILVMASLGSIMAFGTDLVLKFFGMSVTRISHNE
jgi:ABC-type phosphate/phosphonate transport system permease subunit